MELVNTTPFAGQHLITTDGKGKELLLIVAKATYTVSSTPRLAEKQVPIQQVDSYNGPPESSSIRDLSDLALVKPFVDVVLQGDAIPRQSGDTKVDVRFRFGTYWVKNVTVVGRRKWNSMGYFYKPSAPDPIERMPLIYELAYGGVDFSNAEHPAGCDRNPVGLGFVAKHTSKDLTDTPVPCVLADGEDFNSPATTGKTAGFSWIASHWQPRLKYSGTYDDAWLKDVMPHLPHDFDSRFFNAAPEDQQIKGDLQGGELVEIENVGANRKLVFELPKPNVIASLCLGENLLEQPMRCDTVVINANSSLISVVWRAAFDVHQQVNDVHWCSIELDGEAL